MLSPSENIPTWYELELSHYPLLTRLRCLLVSDVVFLYKHKAPLMNVLQKVWWWVGVSGAESSAESAVVFYRLLAHCWSVLALSALTEKSVKSQCTLQSADRQRWYANTMEHSVAKETDVHLLDSSGDTTNHSINVTTETSLTEGLRVKVQVKAASSV